MSAEAKAAPACAHKDFEASVAVYRLLDTGRFSADVRIRCKECGQPFRFIGVRAGLSPYEPRASVDATELRAPIAPGPAELAMHSEFVMPPLPPRTDS